MKTNLPAFEGRPVEAAAMRVTGKADERIGSLDYDEEVFLIVRGRVTKVTHGDIVKGGADRFARTHVVTATSLVIVEATDGARMLDEAAMIADEAFGVPQLFGGLSVDPETGEVGE